MGRPQSQVVGEVCGPLTVVSVEGMDAHGQRYLRCKCICGQTVVARIDNWKRKTYGCGCLRPERCFDYLKKHGQTGSAEYRSYHDAKSRCSNPNVAGYENYGQRGIRFLWASFEEFFKELGPKPFPSATLDRADPNSNYGPGLCQWASKTIQAVNRRPRRTRKQIEAEMKRTARRLEREHTAQEFIAA